MKTKQFQFTINTIKVDSQEIEQINLDEQNNIVFSFKNGKQVIINNKYKKKVLTDINSVRNETDIKIQEELIKEAQDFNDSLLTEFNAKFL